MQRPLLIGQAPGPNTDPEYPLYPVPRTSAGGRLCELMGLTRAEYITTFDRVNLLPYFPGKDRANEDKFPMSPARLAARVLRPMLRGRRVILVGRQVAQAFQLGADWHEWVDFRVGPRHAALGCDGLAQVAVVPHPSGRNHWYNNELNRARARRFWNALLEKSATIDRNVLPFPAS